MNQPRIQEHIRDLQPYHPGKSIAALTKQYNLDPNDIIKLASNENPRGMSAKVLRASASLIAGTARYPDGQALMGLLAQKHGLDVGNIILGNGSNDVLDLVARVYLGPGAEAVSSQFAFSIYQLLTRMTGADNTVVGARDYGYDLEDMAAKITAKTRVVWIANPNNPTGTFLPCDDLRRFLTMVPEQVIVVLDEAYYEYLSPENQTRSTKWIEEFPNVVVTRTFSKAYGLAGFRIGYGLASKNVIALLNRVRQPFNVNEPGIRAACIALDDHEFVNESYAHNQAGLAQLREGFDRLGQAYLPAFGNFLTVEFSDATLVNESLLRRGIIVRPLLEYALPDHLRISVGLPEENSRLLGALAEILQN